MAVDDNAKIQPTATPVCQVCPSKMAKPAMAAKVNPTCSPPKPNSLCRKRHSICGANSKPTKNSIITTPNSATCCMDCASFPTSPNTGPIKIPAAK